MYLNEIIVGNELTGFVSLVIKLLIEVLSEEKHRELRIVKKYLPNLSMIRLL